MVAVAVVAVAVVVAMVACRPPSGAAPHDSSWPDRGMLFAPQYFYDVVMNYEQCYTNYTYSVDRCRAAISDECEFGTYLHAHFHLGYTHGFQHSMWLH